MSPPAAHALYALAWLSFGAGHSLLAAEGVKARLRPLLGPWLRLAYNAVAVLHFALVVAAGRLLIGDAGLGLPAWSHVVLSAVHLLGWAVLLASARWYDLGRFGGLTQIRLARAGVAEPEDEPLRLDGPHRWVRHPLYLGAYLILWGAAQTEFGLATAVWGSLYLAIGTRFEERKLLRLYGDAYADYRRKVPAVIPWKGRAP